MLLISLLVTILPLFGVTMSTTRQTNIQIQVQSWGNVDGKEVLKYTLRNKHKQEVDVISYGATVTAVRTPDKNGKFVDVVLGFDNIDGYLSKDNPYFGATVGRVANRIGKARFTLDGVEYKLAKNIGNNTLHGGLKGWNAYVWNSKIENDTVFMTLLSEDGDEGYPGDVIASVSFQLSDDGSLIITMRAFTTKPTVINLTNHSYFNLAGHASNYTELYEHEFILCADRWTVTDVESIPTGEIRSVANSIMDLRSPTVLGTVINDVPGGGYDYNFCIMNGENNGKTQFIAQVVHPESGRFLQVHSNQPGVQFYTSNFLPELNTAGLTGKEGSRYFKHGAFCLETQNYPDAINHKNFPNSILRPGHLYDHVVTYKFGVK